MGFRSLFGKTEKSEFVTQFVQKCLELRENEQNVVLQRDASNRGHNESFRKVL